MAWTASGLYAYPLAQILGTPATTFGWNAATNKMYLTGVGDTPAYSQALASAIYSSANEVHDSSAWPATGVAFSALATGGTTLGGGFSVTGTTVMNWTANSVSVASTTLTGAYGGFMYTTTAAANYKIIGIWFGGTGYSTVSGTFAVTWAGGIIAAITVATTS